jgi:NADH:ubiquinone oxidoreductase subunit 6 (subunit J)
MRKRNVASITLAVWMLTLSGLMSMCHIPDLRLFMATVLVGFFIVVYTFHPMFSKPGYIRNVHRMAAVCTVLFGLVIVLRILELVRG